MNKVDVRYRKTWLVILACLGWYSLAGQFYLIIQNRVASIPETIIRYFSFFTILTNLLVALAVTLLLLKGRDYLSAKKLTAITLYITIVGLVYNLILRFQWAPVGFQRLIDEMLHTVIPILMIGYWMGCVSKTIFTLSTVARWLVYPFAYFVYILIRGASSGFYPYPFTDVSRLGYPAVTLNCFFVMLSFIIVALLLLAANRWLKNEPPEISNFGATAG